MILLWRGAIGTTGPRSALAVHARYEVTTSVWHEAYDIIIPTCVKSIDVVVVSKRRARAHARFEVVVKVGVV